MSNVMHQQPLQPSVPHKIIFSASGKAGEKKVIEMRPECYFRGESIDARDTLDGAGTMIEMILVGKKLQWLGQAREPVETRALMRAIRQESITFKMDTCQPALSICLAILFKEDCDFRAEITGREVK